jgi:predicted O-methyltransferase YrrM
VNLLELATAIGVEGFLHPVELEKLVELAAGRDVLEVGSYRGLSAWGMAITARSLTCVDTFKACSNGQRQENEFTTLEAFTRATRRYSPSHIYVLPVASQVAAQVSDIGTFDMIFLDAMHTYEDVRDDIYRWRPRLRPGGVFVMHDYGHDDFPGVKQAADEIFGPPDPDTTLVTLRWVDIP